MTDAPNFQTVHSCSGGTSLTSITTVEQALFEPSRTGNFITFACFGPRSCNDLGLKGRRQFRKDRFTGCMKALDGRDGEIW